MSVKHIKEYYNSVSEQYVEMLDNIKDFEEYAKTHVVSPEEFDKLKTMLAPVKENFLTLSYIMYLLNMPNKKSKKGQYERQQKMTLKGIPYGNTMSGKLGKGKEVLDATKNLK